MIGALLLALYRGLGYGGGLAVYGYLRWRRRRGKEHPSRWRERLGYPGQKRPDGRLLWLHAASIGEALSALPLILHLARQRPEWRALVTTGTVTSAAVLAERLPPGVVHQFAPVDLPSAVERFYRYWRPDAALWLESEIWPNLLNAARRRHVPLVLLNARMSAASTARWRRFPGVARDLLGHFAFILAQSRQDEANLRALGAVAIDYLGNLKFAADPLPVDRQTLVKARAHCVGHPLWLAASTHPGEEAAIALCHDRLAIDHPGLITVIVPRHPARGAKLAAELALARRSEGAPLPAAGGLYLADTLGELGLWYRLAPLVLIGGSLVPHGGHNPLEAARLGCAVLHGPHMFNFSAIIEEMDAEGAAVAVADGEELYWQLHRLLQDGDAARLQGQRGQEYSAGQAAALERMAKTVERWLDRLMADRAAG